MKRKIAVLLAMCILAFSGTGRLTVRASETVDTGSLDIPEMLGEAGERLKEAFSGIESDKAMEIFDFVEEKLQDGSLKTKDGLSAATTRDR